MDRNNEGLLQESEKDEFEALVELSEQLSLVRGKAWQIPRQTAFIHTLATRLHPPRSVRFLAFFFPPYRLRHARIIKINIISIDII